MSHLKWWRELLQNSIVLELGFGLDKRGKYRYYRKRRVCGADWRIFWTRGGIFGRGIGILLTRIRGGRFVWSTGMDTWKRKVAVIFLTEIFMFFFLFCFVCGLFYLGLGKREGLMVMVNGQKEGKERRVWVLKWWLVGPYNRPDRWRNQVSTCASGNLMLLSLKPFFFLTKISQAADLNN